jgi:hypothetical protein
MAISICRSAVAPSEPTMPGARLRDVTPPRSTAIFVQTRSPMNETGPWRASKSAISPTSVPPVPIVASTISTKLTSTSTDRPLTVWVPLREVSQPYGVNRNVHGGGIAVGCCTTRRGEATSAA